MPSQSRPLGLLLGKKSRAFEVNTASHEVSANEDPKLASSKSLDLNGIVCSAAAALLWSMTEGIP